MTRDQFTKFFSHMQSRFDDLDKKLDSKASQKSVDRLTITVDHFAKELDKNVIEQASHNLQSDRLLAWAKKVSKRTGIPLKDL